LFAKKGRPTSRFEGGAFSVSDGILAVGIGGFGGQFDLQVGLREKFFGSAGVTSQIAVVVSLPLADLSPSLDFF
jgi:hypothetical protein